MTRSTKYSTGISSLVTYPCASYSCTSEHVSVSSAPVSWQRFIGLEERAALIAAPGKKSQQSMPLDEMVTNCNADASHLSRNILN